MRNPFTTRTVKVAVATVAAGTMLAGCNIGFNPSTIPAPARSPRPRRGTSQRPIAGSIRIGTGGSRAVSCSPK